MSNNQFGKKGWTPDRIENLAGKTYLITGANTGAGFQAAKILLSKGAEVVMLNRNEAGAAEVIKKVPKIDALMCNAAIAQVPTQKITKDGFESHLGVNHYGHFLLCGLLYDKIEESRGRIVVVASEGYKMGIKTIQFDDMNWDRNYHPNSTYCHSKLQRKT